jgi:hypothetical protein
MVFFDTKRPCRLQNFFVSQARDIRESVKRDYDDLVNNLFSTSFSLKNQFEEYRLSLYEDVVGGLYSVRQVGPLCRSPACQCYLHHDGLLNTSPMNLP